MEMKSKERGSVGWVCCNTLDKERGELGKHEINWVTVRLPSGSCNAFRSWVLFGSASIKMPDHVLKSSTNNDQVLDKCTPSQAPTSTHHLFSLAEERGIRRKISAMIPSSPFCEVLMDAKEIRPVRERKVRSFRERTWAIKS